MPKRVEISAGDKFGRLTAIAFVGLSADRKHRRWRFGCDCGTLVEGAADNVRGTTQSCGCLRREQSSKMGRDATKHGMARTAIYSIWGGIIDRCENPQSKDWPRYGGRGIKICDRWRASFEAFLSDMGERPSPRHSVDRWPDVNGNYEPANCRWATDQEQSRNRRSNHRVTIDGRQMTLIEACETRRLSYSAVKERIRLGWSVERALSTKVRAHR